MTRSRKRTQIIRLKDIFATEKPSVRRTNPRTNGNTHREDDECIDLILQSLPLAFWPNPNRAIDDAREKVDNLTGLLEVFQTALEAISAWPVSSTFPCFITSALVSVLGVLALEMN